MIIKEETLAKVNTRELSSFVGLSSILLIVPYFIHLQWITGPLVNAILVITLFIVGIRSALVLCLVPSLVALSSGLLPAVLAPAVPFIMISNVIFVLCIDYLYQNVRNNDKGFISGVAVGALIKFMFLYFSVNLVSGLLIKQELAAKVVQLFSWTQLMTALTGGLLAYAILKFLKRI